MLSISPLLNHSSRPSSSNTNLRDEFGKISTRCSRPPSASASGPKARTLACMFTPASGILSTRGAVSSIMAVALSCQGLWKIYEMGDEKVQAIRGIDLEIIAGEMVAIMGPSGCGKTTLLNITAGFIRPTSGSITLNNKEIDGPGVERGMVFQQGALFEWLTVAENVNFGLRMKKEDPVETQKKVDEWLEIVGLKGFGNTPTYQLSGGMQQRVALARCLINNPDLILMDEPLGALDALTREKMQSLVLKIWKETGKTIILITHSVEEALLLGERLYVMAPRPGRIHKEYNLPFASMGLKEDLREIKKNKEFSQKREEILEMIWNMEEEIMGKDN